MSRTGLWVVVLISALGAVTPGCTGRTPRSAPTAVELGAGQTVERFLGAVDRRDLGELARLFGTEQGPIEDMSGGVTCALRRLASWMRAAQRCPSRQEVEVRMNSIAMVLRHDTYSISASDAVPGYNVPTVRFTVELRLEDRVYEDIGFLLVKAPRGWLVQSVELDKIIGP